MMRYVEGLASIVVVAALVGSHCGGGSGAQAPTRDASIQDSSSPGGGSPEAGRDAADSLKRVFLTSQAFTGGLGGLAGADAKCAADADAAHLGGRWVAFVSTSSRNASDRIVDRSPWYDVTGQVLLFGTKSELSQTPRANITKDEHGAAYDLVSIWTATQGGSFLAPSCEDWTSSAPTDVGVFGTEGASANAILWSVGGIGSQGQTGCDSLIHLLCIEQ